MNKGLKLKMGAHAIKNKQFREILGYYFEVWVEFT